MGRPYFQVGMKVLVIHGYVTIDSKNPKPKLHTDAQSSHLNTALRQFECFLAPKISARRQNRQPILSTHNNPNTLITTHQHIQNAIPRRPNRPRNGHPNPRRYPPNLTLNLLQCQHTKAPIRPLGLSAIRRQRRRLPPQPQIRLRTRRKLR